MSGNAEAQPVDVACAVKQEDEQASSAHGKPLPDQVNALLRKVATAKGAAFVPVQELASLRCSVDLDSQCQAVMTLQTVEAMDEHKSLMKKLIGAANQLRESVAKAASKMTGHLDNIEREVLRSEKKEAGRKEKEAVAKAKAMAKKAAQDVQKVATEVPALFAIERSKLKSGSVQTPVLTDDKVKEADSKPVLFKASVIEKERSNQPKVQMALSAYGGQYKAQSTTKDTGKGQMNLRNKAGKEETEALVKKLLAALQLDKCVATLTGADEIMLKETWLFGYLPNYNFSSPTPQGLAMLKTLAAGEVQMYVIEIAGLMAMFKQQGLEINDVSLQSMFSLEHAAFEELCAECPVYYFALKQWESVYIPTGYIVFERSSSAVLIHGMRKTFCLKGDESRYKAVIEFVKAMGKETARYEQCLANMVAATAASGTP